MLQRFSAWIRGLRPKPSADAPVSTAPGKVESPVPTESPSVLAVVPVSPDPQVKGPVAPQRSATTSPDQILTTKSGKTVALDSFETLFERLFNKRQSVRDDARERIESRTLADEDFPHLFRALQKRNLDPKKEQDWEASRLFLLNLLGRSKLKGAGKAFIYALGDSPGVRKAAAQWLPKFAQDLTVKELFEGLPPTAFAGWEIEVMAVAKPLLSRATDDELRAGLEQKDSLARRVTLNWLDAYSPSALAQPLSRELADRNLAPDPLVLKVYAKCAGKSAIPLLLDYYQRHPKVGSLICSLLFELDANDQAALVLFHRSGISEGRNGELLWAANICKSKGEWPKLVEAWTRDDSGTLRSFLMTERSRNLDDLILSELDRRSSARLVGDACSLLTDEPSVAVDEVLKMLLHDGATESRVEVARLLLKRNTDPMLLLRSLSGLLAFYGTAFSESEFFTFVAGLHLAEGVPLLVKIVERHESYMDPDYYGWKDNLAGALAFFPAAAAEAIVPLLDHFDWRISYAAAFGLQRICAPQATKSLWLHVRKAIVTYEHMSSCIEAAEALCGIVKMHGPSVPESDLESITALADLHYLLGEGEHTERHLYPLQTLRESARMELERRSGREVS